MNVKAVISVSNCQAVVCRLVTKPDGITVQAAENWGELEYDAVEAMRMQGGALNIGALYYCPPQIAMRAQWEETQRDE